MADQRPRDAELTAVARLLVATDFDGTVAPIRSDPQDVRLDPRAEDRLRHFAATPGVAVAFLSGRDLEDLTSRTRSVPAYRSGSHGREIAAADGTILRALERRPVLIDPDLESAARREGFRFEQKKFGVALHWRGLEGVSEDHERVGQFAEWARREGLELVHGRAVLEAAQPGCDKLAALRQLVSITGARTVAYAGDDLTDLPAIEWAATRGSGFFVRSTERQEALPAAVCVVESLTDLLERLDEVLRPFRGPA